MIGNKNDIGEVMSYVIGRWVDGFEVATVAR